MEHEECDEHYINLAYVSVDAISRESSARSTNDDIQNTYEFQLSLATLELKLGTFKASIAFGIFCLYLSNVTVALFKSRMSSFESAGIYIESVWASLV